MSELPPPYQEQGKGPQQQQLQGPPVAGAAPPYAYPPPAAPYGAPPLGAPYGCPPPVALYGGPTAPYPGTHPTHGYPTPSQTYPPVTNQPQHTVVVAQAPVVMMGNHFGEAAVSMTCPHCHCQIVTQRSFEIGGLAWLICLLLAFFGFWLCCFIPFCVDSCKDVEHICPSCHRSLGWYRRL